MQLQHGGGGRHRSTGRVGGERQPAGAGFAAGSPEPPTKEQLIYSVFSKKFEDLMRLKVQAESKLRSYELEVQHLQNCLENATHELKAKDDQLASLGGALQMLEEELVSCACSFVFLEPSDISDFLRPRRVLTTRSKSAC